ncbi:kinase suppressor of Ras 2-like isoform X1 [Mytilus trossulus]|uniref:kinase suppressor of Ras 2-like isoform X1 n=1 Tax=Mytilus trossulus TaxID=6551 RepID=UPI003005E0CE
MVDSSEAENGEIKRAISMCTTAQDMIDFTAIKLKGLREQCDPSEEITQKEIRDTETKLIKLFSKQLVAKTQLKAEDNKKHLSEYPKTEQWLTIVGLKSYISDIVKRGLSLNSLLDMTVEELKNLLKRYEAKEDDFHKLNNALQNLKNWTDKQLHGDSRNSCDGDDLSWSNYKSASSSPFSSSSPKYSTASGRQSVSSLPSEASQPLSLPTPSQSTPSSPVPYIDRDRIRRTPPPTPPLVRPKAANNSRYPSTPPPNKKNHLIPEYQPIKKSKSHESQLANKVTDIDGIKALHKQIITIREEELDSRYKKKPNLYLPNNNEILFRRPSDGSEAGGSRGPSGHASPILPSPIHSPIYIDDHNSLVVPKSPKTPYINHYPSNHRFETKFSLIGSICDTCHKHILLPGKICRECKYKCHRDCAGKAAPLCAPNLYLLDPNRHGSPSMVHKLRPNHSCTEFTKDSESSSCNSSTPSSPFLNPHKESYTPSQGLAFEFPDNPLENDLTGSTYSVHTVRNGDVIGSNTSDDSSKTLEGSNTSEKTLPERVNSVDSQDDPLGGNLWRQNSLSVTLKEWDIPYEQLVIEESIGTGRFGIVYKGHWHGKVAIKMLHMDSDTDNQAQLSAFKQEVAMLKKTRHDNLILFMGACMKPPHLAIVTSYCSGQTLYAYVRSTKEKVQMNKAILVASQIAQGMGYLHARGIIHKDLKSKNIFLENGKVVITDFGLFNVTRLCHGNRKGEWLNISPGWLCYLAPEVIRQLQPLSGKLDLPFSEKSDIYAFGTVWYELLCGEWPFRNQPPETVIWQVGKGLKQSLGSISGTREFKDLLMMCWTFNNSDRPDFAWILKALDRLPKKPLHRSPSHPIHISRSAESVFT